MNVSAEFHRQSAARTRACNLARSVKLRLAQPGWVAFAAAITRSTSVSVPRMAVPTTSPGSNGFWHREPQDSRSRLT